MNNGLANAGGEVDPRVNEKLSSKDAGINQYSSSVHRE